MKPFIFILGIIMCGSVARAQKKTFHLVSYTVPQDWASEESDQVIVYSKEDSITQSYCTYIIYQAMTSAGSSRDDFDFAWHNLVTKPFNITVTPQVYPVNVIKGWSLFNGNALYENDGSTSLSILFTLSGENRMQAICVFTNSQQYKNEIEDFLISVDVARASYPASSLSLEFNNSMDSLMKVSKD